MQTYFLNFTMFLLIFFYCNRNSNIHLIVDMPNTWLYVMFDGLNKLLPIGEWL